MKNGIVLLCALVCLTACSTWPTAQPKPLVAVVDFENSSGRAEISPVLASLTPELVQALHDTRGLRLIDRSRLTALLQEAAVSQSSLADPASMKRVGKLLGADAVLFPQVLSVEIKDQKAGQADIIATQMRDITVSITMTLIAVETGEILAAAKQSVNTVETSLSGAGGVSLSSSESLEASVRKLVSQALPELAKKIAQDVRG